MTWKVFYRPVSTHTQMAFHFYCDTRACTHSDGMSWMFAAWNVTKMPSEVTGTFMPIESNPLYVYMFVRWVYKSTDKQGGTTLCHMYRSFLSLFVCLSLSLSLFALSCTECNVCCQDLSRAATRPLDTIRWIRWGEPDFVETRVFMKSASWTQLEPVSGDRRITMGKARHLDV